MLRQKPFAGHSVGCISQTRPKSHEEGKRLNPPIAAGSYQQATTQDRQGCGTYPPRSRALSPDQETQQAGEYRRAADGDHRTGGNACPVYSGKEEQLISRYSPTGEDEFKR
jgi:hypothetical protein